MVSVHTGSGNLHSQCRLQMEQVCQHVASNLRKTTPSFLHPMYNMSHLSRCRHHQTQDDFYSSLLLLKAQAVAMIGDLQAAIDIVTEWQQTFRDSSSSATVSSEAVDASTWQKVWQEAAEAKDAGNDLFRRGDFTGNCRSAVYNNMIMFSHHALQSFVVASWFCMGCQGSLQMCMG